MSLINQVLRDLDRRARPTTAALPGAVRAVAAAAAVPWPRQAAAATALLGVLAIGSSAWRLGAGAPVTGFGVAEAAVLATADAVGPATGLRLAPASSADVAAGALAAWSLTSSTLRLAASAAGAADTPQQVPPAAAGDAQAAAGSGSGMFLAPAGPLAAADDTQAAAPATGPAPRQPAGPRRPGLRLDLAGAGGDGRSALDGAMAALASIAAGPPSAVPDPAAAGTGIASAAALLGGLPAVPFAPPPPAAGPVRIEKRDTAAGPLERADAAYRLGVDAQQRGDDAAAASEYTAALREDGALAAARVGLAGVRLAQGRPAEAEEVLRAGLAASPRQAALAMPLARLLAARGDLTAAIGVLQAGLPGAAAGNADYRACFGAVLQRAGQHREAIEQFDAALRLAPASGVWWMGLAISLAADSRADAARSAYKHALATGGLSPELAQFVEQRLRQLL